MSDLDQYSLYFTADIKVGVSIPLPNAEVFKDWAVIHSVDEDLVSLQLSRDVLPVSVTLKYGQILELHGGTEGHGYSCRGIIVSEGDNSKLLLRLIGEIVSDELRDFYRIDAFLPIKYYVSSEQNIEILHKQWESRRIQRQQIELEKNDNNWDNILLSNEAVLPPKRVQNVADVSPCNEEVSDAWDTIIPLAANISGGGLRLFTHQDFHNGEYVLLEILVPTPQRVVDVIARIIFSNHMFDAETSNQYYNTGMQFVYIDERDRDAIVNHIANIQLKRIRMLREQYLYRENDNDREFSNNSKVLSFRTTLSWVAAVLLVILITASLINYFWSYVNDHPKSEIERIFEEAVKQYRDKYRY